MAIKVNIDGSIDKWALDHVNPEPEGNFINEDIIVGAEL